MVMRKHQRYFPVFSPAGKLLPAFVTVANGPVDAGAVAAGNEAVLRARFEDAAFFYKEDLKQPLAAFRCARAQPRPLACCTTASKSPCACALCGLPSPPPHKPAAAAAFCAHAAFRV